MEKIFKLDGREFRGLSQAFSAAQDDYILAHLRRSGAIEVLTEKLPDGKRSEELLTRIMLSGETFHIIAGCLTEDGKAWRREEADRNAEAFAAITDTKEKLSMRGALIGFVLGFFSFGEKSAETSPKSSGPTAEGLATASADLVISETLPPSSDPVPVTIQAASTR